ncbi:MAG: DUF4157 domain-containing protein [Verrucomicrobia bacterium]|nr:MAG: DUF4157 domain-containing protein [Verrucomicrobiota bacterium]
MNPRAQIAQPPVPTAPGFTPARGLLLQRQCACGAGAGAGGECEECRKKKLLQRRASASAPASVPPMVEEVLASPGRPLDAGTRGFMEPRFGHDFGRVRIHDDARAAESARAVEAKAYTVGQDVVFGSGSYAPDSASGRSLLAHELSHTIQQRGLQRSTGGVSMPSGVEDQRLEREADAMAARALHGNGLSAADLHETPVRPVVSRAKHSQPKSSKTKPKRVPVNTESAQHEVTPLSEFTGDESTAESFDVRPLFLPGTKGPNAEKLYKAMAAAGGLQATIEVRSGKTTGNTRAGLWQERASTDDLRDRWLSAHGWPSGKDADALWAKAGGSGAFPVVGKDTCQMDHIVELQIGGNNTKENIQALDGSQNRDSGGAIRKQVFELAEKVLTTPGLSDRGPGDVQEVKLNFKEVKMSGTPEKFSHECPPKSPTCLSVEACASKLKVPKGLTQAAGTEPYPIRAGGAPTEIQVPIGFTTAAKPKSVDILADPANAAAAELIPGFLLDQLHGAGKQDTITGRIDDRKEKGRTRLPITIADQRNAPVTFTVNRTTRELKLTKTTPGIKFTYPYLSPGEITKFNHDPQHGMEFSGWIQSRLPLLGRLEVEYSKETFRLAKPLNRETLNKGLQKVIPRAEVTKAELALELSPQLKPSGTLAISAAAGSRKFLDAEFTASANPSLVFDGVLRAYLPGVDGAEGKVRYADGAWTGGIKIETTQLKNKFKYVRGGAVEVFFSARGIDASGTVELDIPHVRNAVLGLKYGSNGWVFSGSGRLNFPRLDETTVRVSYDGHVLDGKVERGPKFDVLGVKGQIDELHYRNGDVSGKGHAEIAKGRFKGKLHLELLPNGRFTGGGSGEFRVTDNLVASAGVELDRNEKLHFTGAITVPKPVPIPQLALSGETEFFNKSIDFPVPGFSIGPIGITAGFNAALSAGYSIGPAELRNMIIMARFDPLEENPNLSVDAGATLFMAAEAHVTGIIGVHAGLDVLIAEAKAGIDFKVTGRLTNNFKIDVAIHYDPARWAVEVPSFHVELLASLLLTIEAWIRGKIGIWPFDYSAGKRWTLKSWPYNSGKLFTVDASLGYSSDKGFHYSGLQFGKPQLSADDMTNRAIDNATSKDE